MTINEKLAALLDYCGIPSEDIGTRYGMRTIQAKMGPYIMVCGNNEALAKLVAQSRENIKALIAYVLATDNLPQLTAIEGALTDVYKKAVETIEASLQMTWEEIKKWMEDK